MDEQLEQIGSRVRKARKSSGMSQAQLAEATGLSVVFISHIEQGKQVMSIKALIAISNALHVSTDWILRNNTQESIHITASEIDAELETCTPEERTMILQLVQNLKTSLQQIKVNMNNE